MHFVTSTTALVAALCLAATTLTTSVTGFDQLTLRASSSDASSHRLIQTSETSPPEWMSERQVDLLRRHRIRFMDITENYQDGMSFAPPFRTSLPAAPKHHSKVQQYLKTMNTSLMRETLDKFTSFYTRYYKSKSGKESQEYLFKQIKKVIKSTGHDDDDDKAKVTLIIARFEGSKYPEETVIVSAHQDSVNQWMPSFGRSPGADDDGSGTVTILESFRALVAGKFQPERSVEFHWYSAEEGGLLGSQDVAAAYTREGRKVVAALQNDMTGYRPEPEVIGVVTDFVDGELTGFLKQLIETYSGVKWSEMRCGYACSDHASWNKYGFRSAFHFETDDLEANGHIHTTRDTVKDIDFNHALRYAKVSVGFAVELSTKSN
ncbi:hypothetical protein BDF19DRAFT_433140 [Syncephalis fuscata]|nr:hypothetical protein BDF19DRAFT_433140 [Syncephalis fuscata]